MARKHRRTMKVKFDKNIALNTAIASLISQQLPGVVQKITKSTTALTETALRVVGAAGCVAYGYLMKNNEVANIGVILSGMDIVNTQVSGMLGNNLNMLNDYVRINPGLALRDYTNNLSVVGAGADNYQNTYSQN